MKLSRSSWHARYLAWCGAPQTTTLCGYVAALLFALTVLPVVTLLVSPFLAVGVGILALHDRAARRRRMGMPHRPSLLLAWLRAKKAKVCPMLDWED